MVPPRRPLLAASCPHRLRGARPQTRQAHGRTSSGTTSTCRRRPSPCRTSRCSSGADPHQSSSSAHRVPCARSCGRRSDDLPLWNVLHEADEPRTRRRKDYYNARNSRSSRPIKPVRRRPPERIPVWTEVLVPRVRPAMAAAAAATRRSKLQPIPPVLQHSTEGGVDHDGGAGRPHRKTSACLRPDRSSAAQAAEERVGVRAQHGRDWLRGCVHPVTPKTTRGAPKGALRARASPPQRRLRSRTADRSSLHTKVRFRTFETETRMRSRGQGQ